MLLWYLRVCQAGKLRVDVVLFWPQTFAATVIRGVCSLLASAAIHCVSNNVQWLSPENIRPQALTVLG